MPPKQVVFALREHTHTRTQEAGDVRGSRLPSFALCLHRVDQIRHGRGRNLFLREKKEKRREKLQSAEVE